VVAADLKLNSDIGTQKKNEMVSSAYSKQVVRHACTVRKIVEVTY
jgi:hypothetical protein